MTRDVVGPVGPVGPTTQKTKVALVSSAARNAFTAQPAHMRGRILGIDQLPGAQAFVRAKVTTSTMREDDEDFVE